MSERGPVDCSPAVTLAARDSVEEGQVLRGFALA
jgi:hypothetical protein